MFGIIPIIYHYYYHYQYDYYLDLVILIVMPNGTHLQDNEIEKLKLTPRWK